MGSNVIATSRYTIRLSCCALVNATSMVPFAVSAGCCNAAVGCSGLYECKLVCEVTLELADKNLERTGIVRVLQVFGKADCPSPRGQVRQVRQIRHNKSGQSGPSKITPRCF